ncbi:hypothetical protein KM043_003969 [Ampulex compressa]|nr:hypothetical protein KM043_003969 [Ampulex compressa]
MPVALRFVALIAVLIVPSQSKPVWTSVLAGAYHYPSAAISGQPHYLRFAAYQDAYSPYYLYNMHTDVRTVPAAVLTNGISHLPPYNYYYGTPVYDFGIPLNPVYPVLRPSHPGSLPRPSVPPTSTPRPTNEDEHDDDDGIEKLDSKVDPESEMKQPEGAQENLDDDSIAVEAL